MISTYSTPEKLQAAIEGWIRYRDMDGDGFFYSQAEWIKKGESMCADAQLHLVAECGLLHRVLDDEGGELHVLFDEITALLERHGYWFERGFSWSVHFYPLDELIAAKHADLQPTSK